MPATVLTMPVSPLTTRMYGNQVATNMFPLESNAMFIKPPSNPAEVAAPPSPLNEVRPAEPEKTSYYQKKLTESVV